MVEPQVKVYILSLTFPLSEIVTIQQSVLRATVCLIALLDTRCRGEGFC